MNVNMSSRQVDLDTQKEELGLQIRELLERQSKMELGFKIKTREFEKNIENLGKENQSQAEQISHFKN